MIIAVLILIYLLSDVRLQFYNSEDHNFPVNTLDLFQLTQNHHVYPFLKIVPNNFQLYNYLGFINKKFNVPHPPVPLYQDDGHQNHSTRLRIQCKNGRYKVMGAHIYLDDVCDETFIKENCRGGKLISVFLYADKTVHINTNVGVGRNSIFHGIDMTIIAKQWEVTGYKTINIEGKPAKQHKPKKAAKGFDGKPGLRGGNGGHFRGYGYEYINLQRLTIIVSGGSGGNGQKGGDGFNGRRGLDGSEKFQGFPGTGLEDIFTSEWRTAYKRFPIKNGKWDNIDQMTDLSRYQCYTDIKFYTKEGECGKIGGKGGNGGVGGLGGDPGAATIIQYSHPSTKSNSQTTMITEITSYDIINEKGLTGSPGKGGKGGMTGEHGKTVTCIKIYINEKEKYYTPENNFWRCLNISDNSQHCPQKQFDYLDGKDDYVTTDEQGQLQYNQRRQYLNFAKLLREKDNYDVKKDILFHIELLKKSVQEHTEFHGIQ